MHRWEQPSNRVQPSLPSEDKPSIRHNRRAPPRLETAKVLTIPRLQHAESQPTHYQPEVSDIVPLEVEEVESHEDGDNIKVMEVYEDQNQPPSNQVFADVLEYHDHPGTYPHSCMACLTNCQNTPRTRPKPECPVVS